MIVEVVLLSPPFAALSYSIPAYMPKDVWQRGLRVAVPLGGGVRVGVITAVVRRLGAGQESQETATGYTLKPVLWPLEQVPLLSESYLSLANELAKRQLTTLGRILGSFLPQGLRTGQMTIRFFGVGKPESLKLKALGACSPERLTALALLWTQGQAEVIRSGRNPLDAEMCLVLQDPPWPVKPAAKKQMALLEHLFDHGPTTRRRLVELFGQGVGVIIRSLAERGVVGLRPVDGAVMLKAGEEGGTALSLELTETSTLGKTPHSESELPFSSCYAVPLSEHLPRYFTLTTHQQEVYEPLLEVLKENKAASRLLFGITGSGKTAVYLELARQALNSGQSVLLLAPEVALAYKLWGDAAQALPGASRLLFHGYQSPSTKEAAFIAASTSKEPLLVIGTRSALFLPLQRIGLIILDEEHDSSFKQDEGFTYQAKEVAWFKAGQENALLLLGSATPDIKTYYASKQGSLPKFTLTERVGGGALPEVVLVPLGQKGATASLLAEESLEALRRTVENGEQAVIMLNRRGYAPLLYCLQCGTVSKCPHCDIGLAYHKGRERLLCHYCGYSRPFPQPCDNCRGMQYLPMGEGTEKIAETLSASLPVGARVLRLDRDSTRRQGSMEAILESFAKKEAEVLVGTQMLSKGHHFPDVTLVVVADADLGLNLPDYRAAERTFQLLLQSAGRAGRGEKKGRVLIQTRDLSHYCWRHVMEADYEGFYAHEIALRQKRKYPPFVRLALVRMSCPMQDDDATSLVQVIGKNLRDYAKEQGVQALGPSQAPIPFLHGRKRFHCLLKGVDWQAIRAVFHQTYLLHKKSPVRITLDLDPVNML